MKNLKFFKNLIYKTSRELDLRLQKDVEDFIEFEKPSFIIDAAAVVGGIWANNEYRYKFLMDNMLIQNNLIGSAHRNNVPKLIFLGSSCIYPRLAPQPLKEEYLLTGPLESTNEWYAVAKISGVKLIEALRKQFGRDYVALMPTNLYGPNDNFDLKTSHVLPAMIRKFHEAKKQKNAPVRLWGTGTPMREFLHVEDLANAVLFSLNNKLNDSFYNVGSGIDITIKELADLVQSTIGHKGEVIWDKSMPDGTPRKLMDNHKIRELGWSPKIDLAYGLKTVYSSYLQNHC